MTQEAVTRQDVVFVGGPLDGHRHPLTHAPEALPPIARIPVNPSLLAFMFQGGRPAEVRGPATSIAVYRLRQGDSVPYYEHAISVADSAAEGHDELANFRR